jgi:hypothetical protein
MGERRVVYRFLVGKPERKDHLEDPGVDGIIILRWIVRRWDCGVMEWTELAEDRDRWRAVVNAGMNCRVP